MRRRRWATRRPGAWCRIWLLATSAAAPINVNRGSARRLEKLGAGLVCHSPGCRAPRRRTSCLAPWGEKSTFPRLALTVRVVSAASPVSSMTSTPSSIGRRAGTRSRLLRSQFAPATPLDDCCRWISRFGGELGRGSPRIRWSRRRCRGPSIMGSSWAKPMRCVPKPVFHLSRLPSGSGTCTGGGRCATRSELRASRFSITSRTRLGRAIRPDDSTCGCRALCDRFARDGGRWSRPTGDALGGGRHRSPCARTGSATLFENSQARVYATRPGGRIKYACLKANGRRIKLDISLGGRRYYPPPAMDLAGPLLLVVTDLFTDGEAGTVDSDISVSIQDLRQDTGALSRSPVPTVNQGDIYQSRGLAVRCSSPTARSRSSSAPVLSTKPSRPSMSATWQGGDPLRGGEVRAPHPGERGCPRPRALD